MSSSASALAVASSAGLDDGYDVAVAVGSGDGGVGGENDSMANP